MTTYLLDTYAWVEYFLGSEKGKRVAQLLSAKGNVLLTPDCVAGEICAWALREEQPLGTLLHAIHRKSQPIEIYYNLWIEAATQRHRMRESRSDFGLIDALLLAIQQSTGATIVTGDLHFEGLKSVEML